MLGALYPGWLASRKDDRKQLRSRGKSIFRVLHNEMRDEVVIPKSVVLSPGLIGAWSWKL